MIKNYLKIAWRNLVRNRAYSIINISGLAVGIASCLLIFLFIQDELSYDRFHKKADRIYRVVMATSYGGSAQIPGVAKHPLTAFPEVEKSVRFYNTPTILRTGRGNAYREKKFYYADSTFFDVFSFPLLKGNPATALAEPNTVVLTETMVRKYFGDTENPIGQYITTKDGRDFRITGIMKDIPHNSSIRFDMLASYATLGTPKGIDDQGYLYLLLNKPQDASKWKSQVRSITKGDLSEVSQRLGFALEDIGFDLQPITDIHLHPALGGAIQAPGDLRYLYIFGAIGIFILLIASINYMNLATAASANRAKEVGMRKVLGAHRLQLIAQFLADSIIFTGIAYVAALCLAQLILPLFSILMGKPLHFFNIRDWSFVSFSIIFVLVLGLVSGSYPMLVLSRLMPQKILKGINTLTNNKPQLRQVLVVVQFTITIGLIAGTLIIQNQLGFIQNERLGYDAEHILTLPMTESFSKRLASGKLKPDPKRIETVEQSLKSLSGVQNVAVAFSTPNGYLTSEIDYQGKNYKVTKLPVGYNYVQTLKMKLIAGRDFSKDHATDPAKAIIINETAARLFNLEGKVGKSIDLDLGHKDPILIGIVKDFHTASFRYRIRPTVITIDSTYYNSYIVRVKAGSLPGVLDRLKSAWKELAPGYPFDYQFLDTQLQAQYDTERRVASIFGAFSTLAIIISCLGLFGLAAFTVQRRTKEIGIRKVLGATISNILELLSKDFLKLVLIGFVLAIPIAWYAMNQWLAEFAYKIKIGPDIFMLAGGIAVAIALVTVSWQSIRAALANPVDSLRSE